MTERIPYYINGIGLIAPQRVENDTPFLQDVNAFEKNVLTCVTPDFKTYLNPAQLRRLSRMLRIGLTSATLCLRNANVTAPDGIITATGYGFLEETEKFLREILDRHEKHLTPTYFIHGTYNALAGLIGLSTQCKGYNNTYVSKGFAFENALEDTMLQLAENQSASLLVGSYDESAEVLRSIGIREGYLKTEAINSLLLFESQTPGTIQGEGSAFFLLSALPSASTWCTLQDLQILYHPHDEGELSNALSSFLDSNRTALSEIDLVISGASGDISRDFLIRTLEKTLFQAVPVGRFKHLCGEYCTAISFGVWLAARILKTQFVPEIIRANSRQLPIQKLETVLIVNQYLDRNYSFVLMKR